MLIRQLDYEVNQWLLERASEPRHSDVRSLQDNVAVHCSTSEWAASQSSTMTTKETTVRRVEGWTTHQQSAMTEGRDSVETGESFLARERPVSDGQGTGTSSLQADTQSPSVEHRNELCQAYRWSLQSSDDDACVNLGTSLGSPDRSGVGQPASTSQVGGGVSVVVREGESPSHGEGGQSNSVQRLERTKQEDERMHRLMIAQKQRTLAVKAQEEPSYRFNNLYNLLHWEKWLNRAANLVLSRPGSDSAGIDGTTRDYFKQNRERLLTDLMKELKEKRYEPSPVRRVHIPKANGKKRPLGIATLRDRIVQEALRMALDPIYESDFQPYSFGFRKGRRTMDAIAVLMPQFNSSIKKFYVIEGDLESYFDTVNHRKLLSLLKQRIKDRDVVDLLWKFLKAGVMEGRLFSRTETGVPQGGIISPLLANLYLNEFDKWCEAKWHRTSAYAKQKTRRAGRGTYTVVRYADDFVVVTNDTLKGVRQAKAEIKTFLESELRLKLSEEKTKITHVNKGFDFLGFHIQRYQPEGRWVVHLRPSQKSIQRFKKKLKTLTSRSYVRYDEVSMLSELNRSVRGWCEYYKHVSLQSDLEQISRYMWHRYHFWLLKKYKGSRKVQLIKDKTRVIFGRTRWIATVREGEKSTTVHQWLPSPKELKRSKYRQKGRQGFEHPYLFQTCPSDLEEPKGEMDAAQHVYEPHLRLSALHNMRPADWQLLRLRTLIRDDYVCQTCGSGNHLEAHGKRGSKSRTLRDFVTLCRSCHKQRHRNHCE